MAGIHVAVQGTGSVGGGVARLLVKDGARLTLADIDAGGVTALAQELGAEIAHPDAILTTPCDVFSPNALGAILDDDSIAGLQTQIVAGGANNQLARSQHGKMLFERGILYAPDYVLNAGGIISVATEYLGRRDGKPGTVGDVNALIEQIPGRLAQIWKTSDMDGISPDVVADRMAQELIGRA